MTTNDKANITEQLSLAFELYQRIPQGRKVTAKQLQLELMDAGINRSIRSIQRNLDVIVDYFDVDKDTRSKPFGYSRGMYNPVTLGARELILLQLAKSTLTQQLPSSLECAIESAFNFTHIQPRSYTGAKPPQGGANKANAITDKLSSLVAVGELFEPISIALVHQKQITLTLASREQIERISPIGLTVADCEFYLVYQNHLNEYDDLPLTRIAKLRVLTFHFDYPSDFQLQQYQLKSEPKRSIQQLDNITQLIASDR
ncbi:hypothetical protein CWO27_20965 [Vibrio sp. 10N.286.51.C3]|uniref:WYL domain-containing protein n=1 Tax=unclassified Vibrio TaxID=2614977 RepID=UPI000D3C8F08|nr:MULTISPECIES: WYL domain-containing protein [unclassified Vibrio]PTP12087.1 hypothetical protein CWO27_20965 [Vibrio sp. 10N.286.51.C3]TKE65871.1 hypothetical protein FCV45_11410 [Vibrio sp. F12]